MSDAKESQYLSVIRVWAAMAWADGVMAESEAEAIRRLIAVAELTGDERATADSFLNGRVELETASISGLSDAARAGIYRAALRLAMVDQDVADEELQMLSRIREGLGLSAEAAKEIRDQL
jgi:uncharacterized tellurite resistance protein B-like protein